LKKCELVVNGDSSVLLMETELCVILLETKLIEAKLAQTNAIRTKRTMPIFGLPAMCFWVDSIDLGGMTG
jgi:hypothetical protein